MNRTLLSGAIERLATEYGYDFQQGEGAYYPTTVCRYPSAFLSQPKFVSIEGRKHGRITYETSLSLARQGAKLSPSERNTALAEMEQEVIDIFTELSKSDNIAVIDHLTITPSADVVDNHGAIVIVAEAKVTTIF